MSYYSIYIPSKIGLEANDEPLVFTKKEEAFKVFKNHKDARLKIFKNNEDAINYAQTGNEMIIQKFSDLKSPSNLEKSKFRAPTKQELIQFRKAIEENKYELVKKLIYEDPRYLVNSADTPTSLKDGPRYNALHVCAIHKRSEIAALILETISDVSYIEYLHGRLDTKINQEVSDVLLDYYLNMPEKGRSETPLHLASKYGAVDVVEVLTNYPQCKMVPNLDNLLPKDIVCSRIDNPSIELKEKILSLLDDRFYVPVIRSIDNSIPPVIGEPFSPTNPPNLNLDPKSPELKIQAYAGPIRSKEEAQKFRRRWKTPPRNGVTSPIANKLYMSPLRINSSTPNKALNNNNNNNIDNSPNFPTNCDSVKKNLNFENEENETEETKNMLSFPPLTPLIKNPNRKELFFTYRDRVASPIIVDESDSFSLDGNNWETSSGNVLSKVSSPFGLRERHLKLADTEKGFEVIGRELAKEQNIEWKEYWDFLDTFIDIASDKGLIKLEEYLEKKSNQGKMKNMQNITNLFCDFKEIINGKKTEQNSPKTPNKILNNFSMSPLSSLDSTSNIPLQQTTTPYLCVEKSLQVYANRMTKTILHNIDSVISINDAFINELKRLKSLICSFRDDTRFLDIDFNVIHSRFANLIVTSIYNSLIPYDSGCIQKIKKCFQQIIESNKKKLNINRNEESYALDTGEQLQCISEMILDYLENLNDNKKINQSDNIKTEQICLEIWREEFKCNCNWKTDLSRQKSVRKRRLINYLQQTSSQTQESIVTNENHADVCSDDERNKTEDDDEEDVFWSDIESNDDIENEKFYTPPESPVPFDSDSNDESYSIFLIRNEPTKRDWDVVKALCNVEINKEIYPNIYKWRKAVLSYTPEERENFPSPTVNKERFHLQLTPSAAVKHRLFSSTVSIDAKNEEQINHDTVQNSSEIQRENIDNSLSVSKNYVSQNLSFLNVSDLGI